MREGEQSPPFFCCLATLLTLWYHLGIVTRALRGAGSDMHDEALYGTMTLL